jgi:NADH-quinone oxidoreductase subunit L
MFRALGAGVAGVGAEATAAAEAATHATTAGMFHLYTHAFFKALLFLAAGSVMHSMGDVIDMRRFSGLRRALPTTHWTFLCGAAALAGVPLLSGFWSKDEILAVLHRAGEHGPHGWAYTAVFVIATVTAGLTAFYTFRAYFLTFWGEERFPEEAGHYPHDAPPVMAWPLWILAACAVGIGLLEGPTGWFAGYLHHTSGLVEVHEHGFEYGLMAISVLAVVVGIGLAWLFYVQAKSLPGKVAAAMGPFYRASLDKLYFDEIFWAILVGPLRGIAWFASWFDRHVIDSIVDGLAHVPKFFSWFPMWIQNGRLPGYALVMWFGLIVCMLFAIKFLPYLHY